MIKDSPAHDDYLELDDDAPESHNHAPRFQPKLILITLAIAFVAFFVAQIGSMVYLFAQVNKLDRSQEELALAQQSIQELKAKMILMETMAISTDAKLNQFNLDQSEGHLATLASINLQQELNQQMQLQRLSNSLLRLSRMVPGSREWHADVREDLQVLLTTSKKIESQLYELVPNHKPNPSKPPEKMPEAVDDPKVRLQLSSF